MKNYFRLNLIVMLLALPFIFSACSNDDDNAPVARIAIEERGGVQSDGSLYIANGDSICIDRIKVVPEESVPAAMITLCDYYGDFLGHFISEYKSANGTRWFYSCRNVCLQIRCGLFFASLPDVPAYKELFVER